MSGLVFTRNTQGKLCSKAQLKFAAVAEWLFAFSLNPLLAGFLTQSTFGTEVVKKNVWY